MKTSQQAKRSFIRKQDVFLVVGLILVGLGLYFWTVPGNGGAYAGIIVDGAAQLSFDLSGDQVFSIDTLPGVYFEIRNGAVAFIESDCPVQICVRSGFISHPGQRAVCLPKRAVLFIENPASSRDLDIIIH